jgi:SagB-type dehydrogenase family enzyme
MFRERYPAAWGFHANTVRWPHNTIDPEDATGVEAVAVCEEDLDAPTIRLPEPMELAASLGEVIAGRLSCRHFDGGAISLGELGTLLRNAYGVIGRVRIGAMEHLERPVPSGGGLYPLEVHVIARRVEGLGAGVFHFVPQAGLVERVREVKLPDAMVTQLFMNQGYVAGASAIVVLSAAAERSMRKYGERGYRYILFEAGHVAQNVNLACVALGLASLNLGGFFDAYLAELLKVDPERVMPLYAVAVGRADGADRSSLRYTPELAGEG